MVGIRKQNRDHKRTLRVKGCKVMSLVFCSMYLFSEHARKKREGNCHFPTFEVTGSKKIMG